ncbi:MAG: hypothetical protein ACYTGG_03080 [Planctomycetota bacterium]|jgi:hypothetical protein
MNRDPAILLLLLTLLLTGGCTTLSEPFPEFTPAEVWTAAKAVAESPVYDDWMMSSNDVWFDPDANRIEIERRLKRHLHRAGAEPLYQERNFRFTITLKKVEPPTIKFINRGFNIPGHAHLEAERYFRDMHNLLAGEIPEPPATAPDDDEATAPPPPTPARPDGLEQIGPDDVGAPGGG